MPGLVEKWFTHLSEERRENLARQIKDLYRLRIASDYSLERADRISVGEAYRITKAIFRILEVKL